MLNKVIKRIGRKKKNSRAQKQNKKSRRGETREALGKEKRILGFSKKSIEIDAQRFFLFPVFPLRKCSIALYSWIENCQKPEKVYVVVKSPATTKTILKIA